jgi:hypothetical protein
MRNRERIFKNQKNKVTALIRAKKRNFINSLVQMAIGNPKKMWPILKFIFQNRFFDPSRIMGILNEYFATIA